MARRNHGADREPPEVHASASIVRKWVDGDVRLLAARARAVDGALQQKWLNKSKVADQCSSSGPVFSFAEEVNGLLKQAVRHL